LISSIQINNMIIKNLSGYYITVCSKCDELVDKHDKHCPNCGHEFKREDNALVKNDLSELEDKKTKKNVIYPH